MKPKQASSSDIPPSCWTIPFASCFTRTTYDSLFFSSLNPVQNRRVLGRIFAPPHAAAMGDAVRSSYTFRLRSRRGLHQDQALFRFVGIDYVSYRCPGRI